MTIAHRLRNARRALAASLIARALVLGLIAVGTLIGGAAALDLALGLSLSLRRWLPFLAALAFVFTSTIMLWRGRRVRSARQVALWLEERVPALEYALVTLLESPAPATAGALGAHVRGISWAGAVRHAVVRGLAKPLLALALVILFILLLPRDAVTRVSAPAPGDALRAGARPAAGGAVNHLTPLVATVTPPAYSGSPARVLDEPTEIAALVGSDIALRGRGAASVAAAIGTRITRAMVVGGEWRLSLTMPDRPVAVRLADGAFARLLALAPRADAVPAVTLDAPIRDSVLRNAVGAISLAARARDDIAVEGASFEYIISSGSGESFTFRSGTLGAWRGHLAEVRLDATLPLGELALKAGDVVHVRAIASDGNVVSGPGKGSSETRTLRIARVGEYDSVAVEGAPPPDAEKSVLSQRMLIILAEELEAKRRRLERSALTAESRRIGADQTRLRRQVGEIIFARLGDEPEREHAHGDELPEGKLSPEDLLKAAEQATGAGAGEALDFAEGESPVVAINRPLLEAYNAMWDASRELDVGEPARALPHMRAALAAIQRARRAERIYLRGRPAAIVVDLARVRLQGEGLVTPAPRHPRSTLPDPTRARAERFAAAVALLDSNPGAAVDSLLLLRVETLADAPRTAEALGTAIDALRAERDATGALLRSRRELLGAPVVVDSLGAWSRRP